MSNQPASMESNLSRVKNCMLYGRKVMSYTKTRISSFYHSSDGATRKGTRR